MSTLKEQALIIRNETIPGANTAQRVGDMFVNLVDEVEKKLSTGSLAQGTGSSTTTPMSQDAVTKELAKKQDTLVSGVSIKTINGQSILGLGNIVLSGGTGGTVIPLKKGSETSYNTTTTTTTPGGELFYNSATVKIYYRVSGVNYTDWNVEGFYPRADVCAPNGIPNTGAFYLLEDELKIFNGTKMVAAYNGVKIHYLDGLPRISCSSQPKELKSALVDVKAFCDAVENRDTIFYDLSYNSLVVLSAQIYGIDDTALWMEISAFLQFHNFAKPDGHIILGQFTFNRTTGEIVSIDKWEKKLLSEYNSDPDQTKLFHVKINESTNFHGPGSSNTDNILSVKLDKPLPDGYHIVFMRRKKVKYDQTLNRDARNKGFRYCLVVGSEKGNGGFIGSSYRGRVSFLQDMEFKYDATGKKYILRTKAGKNISAFDFAKHYTEYDTKKNELRVSTAGGCKFLSPITAGTNNMIKIQFAVAVVRYYGKNQDSGFIVCSNLAKVNFGFANNRKGEEIDISTENGLYEGFQVFVRN